MRIECRHGYFLFEELKPGELSDFMSSFGLELERSGDGGNVTFADLADAPDFSLPGGDFLGAPTTVLFEGRPWEVMRENGLVYDFRVGLVVPILSILQTVRLEAAGNAFIGPGMIVPGSITDDGRRVTDYAAFYKGPGGVFEYTEVTRG